MSHGKQEPMESGRYHDIIIATSSSWRHCLFAFTKMADSQNYRQKYTWLLPSIYTFFGLILTCIRNDIVLHVYFNPKCNENWRKAAYHASSNSIQRVVSGTVCVCDVRLPNFALVILPGKLIMGDIKFLSKIKYFPDRPTWLSGPYVTGTKQLFCHGLIKNITSWLTLTIITVMKWDMT